MITAQFSTARNRRRSPGRPVRSRSLAGRLTRGLVLGSVVALVAFHAFLFWSRIESLTLFEPLVAVRWMAAALLTIGMVRLYRRTGSVLRGQHALVFWALIILLHAAAVVPAGDMHADLAILDASLIALMAVAITAVFVRLARHLGTPLIDADRRPAPPFLSPFAVPARASLQDSARQVRLPRPPPAV